MPWIQQQIYYVYSKNGNNKTLRIFYNKKVNKKVENSARKDWIVKSKVFCGTR